MEVEFVRFAAVTLPDVAAEFDALGIVRGEADGAESAERETVGLEILRARARGADEHKRQHRNRTDARPPLEALSRARQTL